MAPKARAAAETPLGAALTLANAGLSAPPADDLSTDEVAQKMGRSSAWVKRHVGELGGRRVDGNWRFPIVAVEQRIRTVTERITLGPRATQDFNVGPRAAAIFDRLELRQSISQIVRDLCEPPEFVMKVREQWRKGYELDREGLVFMCGCGQPSAPDTAKCAECAGKSWTVSDTQREVLAAVTRLGADALGVVVEAGVLRVVLKGSRTLISRAVSGEEWLAVLALAGKGA